jgi:predicted nucleotidyltransferase component of viral defense system
MNLHTEILPDQQKRLFDILSEQIWIAPFYLAGGTSLALQIAHRQSVDFDFFTKNDFDNRDILEKLRDLGKFELFNEARNTINALLNSPFRHKNMRVANMEDIALMKLEAISGRGSKKDFIDLYFLLRDFSLSELFEKYPLKYGIEVSNHYHLLKSLAYFEDAEHEPMPKMFDKM